MKRFKISPNSRQIILLVIVVLLARIVYVDLYNQLKATTGITLYSTINLLLKDYLSMALMLGLTIFCTLRVGKYFPYGKYPAKRTLLILLLLLIISIIVTIVANRKSFFELKNISQNQLSITLLASLFICVIIMIITDLSLYFYKSNIALKDEKDKKNKVQYQYTQLKQQLNPHFLINSLSLLDYLVQNNNTAQASSFIKKLANVYRYLLSTETERVVQLNDEINFLNSYISLLKERFVDSLNVKIDIPDEFLTERMIVPCGLQILVENATKHNIVNKEHPLQIDIFIEGEMIVTRNNLQPRYSQMSMGIGLQNLKKQYADLSDTEVVIEKTDIYFIVKLPLISDN